MSEEIRDLVNPPPSHKGPVEGTVRRAPGSLNEPLYAVIIGEDDEEARVGPCAWTPRGDAMPEVDDPCAIAFTDSNTPVVVAWWSGEWP